MQHRQLIRSRHVSSRLTVEQLELRRVLSGSALIQPFSEVDYFGSDKDWSVNVVNAPEVWAEGYTGENVVVAVIDTGVDVNHVEFVGSLWENVGEVAGNNRDDDGNGFIDDVHGWNFVSDSANVRDDSGHGTQIAGTITASRDDRGVTGVAYDATIMPVRVLDAKGYGTQADIAAGIRYAVDNGAQIINLSFGGLGSQRVERALAYAGERNVLVVAAAGNTGNDSPDYPARYSADHDNVLSVGAFTRVRTEAQFSNHVGDSGAIQITAPGESIYATGLRNDYLFTKGTSSAAAYVSGVAALMLSANPNLSAAELRTFIVDSANVDVAGSDAVGGLNAAYAVAIAARSHASSRTPGDFDGSGTVEFGDFLILSKNFGHDVSASSNPVSQGDVDGSGTVDFADFLAFSGNFQPQPAPPIASDVDQLFACE